MTEHDTTLRTYTGGCHCGAVRYRARIDLGRGASKCNCSICTKSGVLGAIVKPDAFELTSGDAELVDYQFGGKTQHHLFCRRCGVRSFGRGELEQLGGAYVSINVACLDGVSLTELPTVYWDGKNENWQAGPSSTPYDGGAR